VNHRKNREAERAKAGWYAQTKRYGIRL